MKHVLFVCAVALMGLSACSSEPAIPEGETVYEIDDAYIVAPAPGMKNTSGGMTVTVQGAAAELIEVSSEIAPRIELHTMSMKNGMMSMRRADSFPVTSEAPLELKRGGNHLMLFGLDEVLEVDSEIDLALTFMREDGATQVVITSATIKDIAAE